MCVDKGVYWGKSNVKNAAKKTPNMRQFYHEIWMKREQGTAKRALYEILTTIFNATIDLIARDVLIHK